MKIKEEDIPGLMQQGKDKEVIPILYNKVLPLVQKFITRNSGSREDAFDVFQDALLIFYKQVSKGTFDPKYKPYGYLYRMSINLWINKIKKERKIQYKEEIDENSLYTDASPYPELILVNKPEENVLKRLFSKISEKCIEMLTYTIYQNLLLEDVTLRMGISSVDACKMQVMRCKKKLVEMIENDPTLVEKLKSR